MTARRSSSDPISHYLATGERVVWRHQPEPRTLFYNRLPSLVLVLIFGDFVGWVAANVIGNALPDQLPSQFDPWLVIPAIFIAFTSVILFFYARFTWNSILSLLDSWSTHYALTDRCFLIVSKRGIIEYGASYFRKMEACDGKPGAQVLLFDWGPAGRRQVDAYRDRIAALPDAKKLEQLIRTTLHA